MGVAVVNRLLYAVGGFDGVNRLRSVECYHPENDEWNFVAPMTTTRSGAGKPDQLYIRVRWASKNFQKQLRGSKKDFNWSYRASKYLGFPLKNVPNAFEINEKEMNKNICFL